MTTGIVFFVLPQLLAAEHVSEVKIAAITAVAMSPNFWAVVFSPMLDVRFSRRWYATVFAAAAAISAAVAILNLSRLLVLECAAVLSIASGGELVHDLPIFLAAVLLGAMVFLPATIFLFIPAPGPDGRLAGESFAQFNREIWTLLRRREVVVVLLLFLSPCSSFALTNLLGGLGDYFHASARAVSLAGGVGCRGWGI